MKSPLPLSLHQAAPLTAREVKTPPADIFATQTLFTDICVVFLRPLRAVDARILQKTGIFSRQHSGVVFEGRPEVFTVATVGAVPAHALAETANAARAPEGRCSGRAHRPPGTMDAGVHSRL